MNSKGKLRALVYWEDNTYHQIPLSIVERPRKEEELYQVGETIYSRVPSFRGKFNGKIVAIASDADELERTGVKLAAQGPPEVDLHQIKEKPQFSSSSQSNRSENKSSSKRKGEHKAPKAVPKKVTPKKKSNKKGSANDKENRVNPEKEIASRRNKNFLQSLEIFKERHQNVDEEPQMTTSMAALTELEVQAVCQPSTVVTSMTGSLDLSVSTHTTGSHLSTVSNQMTTIPVSKVHSQTTASQLPVINDQTITQLATDNSQTPTRQPSTYNSQTPVSTPSTFGSHTPNSQVSTLDGQTSAFQATLVSNQIPVSPFQSQYQLHPSNFQITPPYFPTNSVRKHFDPYGDCEAPQLPELPVFTPLQARRRVNETRPGSRASLMERLEHEESLSSILTGAREVLQEGQLLASLQEPQECANCVRLTDQLRETNERLSAVRMQLESRAATAFGAHRLQNDGLPRQGLVSADMARKHGMLELVPGTDVWVYPKTIRVAIKKAEKSTTKCARYLMSCFYTTSELVKAGNVTGKNGKPGLDERIREAIITYAVNRGGDESAIKYSMRTRISALVSAASGKGTKQGSKQGQGNKKPRIDDSDTDL